jgi:hypothetical protein
MRRLAASYVIILLREFTEFNKNLCTGHSET